MLLKLYVKYCKINRIPNAWSEEGEVHIRRQAFLGRQ